jgi:hypothetical protein
MTKYFVFSLYLFFILLPFTYLFQVLAGTPSAAIFTYVFLVLAMAGLLFTGYQQDRLAELRRYSLTAIPVGFLLVLLHHLYSVAVSPLTGDTQLGVRGLFLFTLPLGLFWLPQLLKAGNLRILVILLALGGLCIAGEMLYENVSANIFQRPTAFQMMNRQYVMSRNAGQELTQLFLSNYRPPGLLEHVHAVTLFVALATLAHLVLFCLEGRWYWLVGMTFCGTAVMMHGTRLPVVAALLAIGFLAVLFFKRERDRAIRKRAMASVAILVGVMAFQLIVDPLGTTVTYYRPAITKGDLQVSGRTTMQMIMEDSVRLTVNSEWGKMLMGEPSDRSDALFGHGIVGSLRGDPGFNDDLFVFAVLSQYGLIVGVVFFVVWFSSIFAGARSLWKSDKASDLDRALLYFSVGVLIILGLSLLHSSVLQRKAIYPFFPLAAGIIWRYRYLVRINKF